MTSTVAQKTDLGNTYENTQPPSPVVNRFRLQDQARKLLPKTRIQACLRSPLTTADHVTVHRTIHLDKNGQPKNGHHYGNLMVCGSVWTCPVCASKITEKRRVALLDMIGQARAQGCSVAMLTLTVPHQHDDVLEDLLAKVSKARRLMLNRKPWKALAARSGLIGDVRVLEVTRGQNGWHPHYHCLLVFDRDLTEMDDYRFRSVVLTEWIKACLSAGLKAPNDHGVDFTRIEEGDDLANYITKDIAAEVTKGQDKLGRVGGKTPFQLLDDFARGDAGAGHWFQVYAGAFKGKRQLVYAKSLVRRFRVDDRTDDELATSQEEPATVLAVIPMDAWRSIVRAEARGAVLAVACHGRDALIDFISGILMDDQEYGCANYHEGTPPQTE